MRFTVLLFLLICVPLAVHAQENGDGKSDPVRDIRILCQQLTAYHNDGSVDYVPETDVMGRKVAPADLEAAIDPVQLNYPIKMAITLDEAKQYNLLPTIGYTPRMFVGFVELHKDGSVYFDGKRVNQPQTQFLCDADALPPTTKTIQKGTPQTRRPIKHISNQN